MSSMTGTFAAVAKTQKEAFTLAIDQKNQEGGLSMPWGKVTRLKSAMLMTKQRSTWGSRDSEKWSNRESWVWSVNASTP